MTESINDNSNTVDNLTFITFDDNSHGSVIDGEEDFFFCRKCNKLFKNLPQYLEHKIKEENFRIVQTRSDADRRMVLPKLVQKNKKIKAEVDDSSVTVQNSSVSEPAVQHIKTDRTLAEKEAPRAITKNEKYKKTWKRGRKRKIPLDKKSIEAIIQSCPDMYICKICDKKFRREASLRWHMAYEHQTKNKDEEDLELSDEDHSDDCDDNDKEFTLDSPTNEKLDHESATDKNVTLENSKNKSQGLVKVKKKDLVKGKEQNDTSIHLLINQPLQEEKASNDQETPCSDKGSEAEEAQEKGKKNKGVSFSCNICQRCFKEAGTLKAHQVVHSDERNFICKFDNCPYGFKTKGGLVRHERRHTGERPYVCDKCNRAFSESGALTRHLKARRNCSETPDSAYPRYMKSWTYYPNIPAVLDPNLRDSQKGRSMLPHTGGPLQGDQSLDEVHFIITEVADPKVVSGEMISPKLENILPHLVAANGEIDTKLEIKLETENIEEWVTSKEEMEKSTEVSILGSTAIDAETLIEKEVLPHKENTKIDTDETDERKVVEVAMEVEPDLVELKNVVEVDQLKVTQCHVCKKDFEALEGLELHLRNHLADQPTRCGLCHFLSNDREELRLHILSLHYESLNDIEASVLSMEEDSNLTKIETMDRKVVLRNALTAVKQLYSLKKNKTVSEVEKPGLSATGTLQCMVCNRLFRGNSYLRQHMRSHTGDRPYRCHQCDRSFTTRDILKKHMYVHKEQRDFKCGECGKLFKSLSHVRQHLRVHMHERSYRCSVCDKMFKTQNTLKVHLRTHSGVNPYKCQICGNCFRERGSLQRHMRLHTGEKPFKCHKCNRAFAEQGTLIRHHRAKVPCTAILEEKGSNNTTMLAQFSSVVAGTQYILPEGDTTQQYVLPADQEITENYVILQTTGDESEIVDNFEVITEERVSTEEMANFSENQDTESLEIFDSSTGESVIIVADKSIVDLVREQQKTLLSEEGSSSMQKIKDILIAAGKGGDIVTTYNQEPTTSPVLDVVEQVIEPAKTDSHFITEKS
ncbi:transcription factor E4F1 [Biomphalaria pfeifferi]|uniref:Transcription factor E4F1 n=1 Tax=Biomphalaria pfeifferi TaxID=112525 RepID=A0AAD8B1C2_BIOPF|nr:transcription factor E4F1 [Biomphalaria pfeifferi]